LVWWTRVLAILAGLQFIALVLHAFIFRIQAKALQDSIKEMQASRRAWLSIEDVKLKHPTRFTEEGIVFAVDVTVKNLGQTPATSVDVKFESYFNQGEFRDAEERFKVSLRAHPIQLGEMLFPNDTLKQGQIWTDGIEKISKAINVLPSGEKQVGFTMFIGVTYRIIGDSSAYFTYRSHYMLNIPIGLEMASGTLVDIPRKPFLAGEVT
jgi:hypothetical protein